MPITIDNPAGGDCGFYAFAIGLIEIIQKENQQADGNCPTFILWQQNGLNDASLKDLLEVDLNALRKAPRSYKSDLLNTLQMSLRSISAQAIITDLKDKISKEQLEPDYKTVVEGASLYVHFMELVQEYLKKRPSYAAISAMGKFNELAMSAEVKQLARETADGLSIKFQGVEEFEERQKIENHYVKEVIIKDVTKPDSLILKAVGIIKAKGRWATHDNLKEVAAKLVVNLHVTDTNDGDQLVGRPTVSLTNHYNAHWTTQVNDIEPVLKSSLSETKPVKPVRPVRPVRPVSPLRPVKRVKIEPAEVKQAKTSGATSGATAQKSSYQEHVTSLKDQIKIGFFSQNVKPNDRLDIAKLDIAHGVTGDTIESQIAHDEDFAIKLQEAELRSAGFIPN